MTHGSNIFYVADCQDAETACDQLRMVAKFNSKCQDRCGLTIHAGHDEIESGHFGFRHVNCEQASINAQVREKLAEGWTADLIWAWLERAKHLTVQQRIDAIFYASREAVAA